MSADLDDFDAERGLELKSRRSPGLAASDEAAALDFDRIDADVDAEAAQQQTSDDVSAQDVAVAVSASRAGSSSSGSQGDAADSETGSLTGGTKKKRRSKFKNGKLSKREKLKMTFFWILLVVCMLQLIAITLVVVTYEAALDVLAVTEPKWLAWDISPGAFSGCRSLPPQLYGSFGPSELMFWNITSGEPQKITEEIAGPYLAGDWLIDEVIGTPNGVTLIRWAQNGFNQGVTSVECATAWGTWDLNYGWENGIIYNFTGHSFVYFGHIWRRTEKYFEIWEVLDYDLSYHIDAMRDAIEGRLPDYELKMELRYLKAPMMQGNPDIPVPNAGIPAPPPHKWCWNYDDCEKYLQTTEEVEECWDSGVCTATQGDSSLDTRV